MKIKTQELTRAALDWAVARAEEGEDLNPFWHPHKDDDGGFRPSTNWAHGGLIIEREKIGVRPPTERVLPNGQVLGAKADGWFATIYSNDEFGLPSVSRFGPTPLIAAMRCFCAAKFGDEVDIPEELLK